MTGRLSFGYFSLAKQRKVTGVREKKFELELQTEIAHHKLRRL